MTTAISEVNPQEFVSKRALAEKLGVCERTIDSWVKAKKIPSVRITARCIRYHVPSVKEALLKLSTGEK